MNKLITILQRILRIIMLIVALALLGSGLFLIGVHTANKNSEKTSITGTIVYGDDLRSVHEVRYKWHGKTIERRPLDVYFHKLGDVGDKIPIYVENAHPTRIFVSPKGNDLINSAAFMSGWGLLLIIILIGEHQMMSRIRHLEKLEQEQKKD